MGNFPDNSSEDLPWLPARGGGGVHLEQFYKTLHWFLRSSWAILHLLCTFVYFCEIRLDVFTLTIINFVFHCCLCCFSTIFREFWKKKLRCQKKKHLQIKKGTVLILLCICSIYKKETLHTRFCMIFRGDVFFWHFSCFSRFLTFYHFPQFSEY